MDKTCRFTEVFIQMNHCRSKIKRMRLLSLLLVLTALLLCACGAAPAAPEPVPTPAEAVPVNSGSLRRAVIGADLTEEQIKQVYGLFGFPRGEVPELTLTSAEEHEAMRGHVDEAVLGTKTISSVYLELLPAGSGYDVRLVNITWCTPEMVNNALETIGIQDARVVIAAPFSVSGTGAVAGIYKAYEDMAGQTLDAGAKDAGTQELTVTGELAEEIGANDSEGIISELKSMLNETPNMTDEEIRETIRGIAARHKVRLTDAQVEQLLDLSRTLEKLDPDALKKRVEDAKQTIQKVEDTKDQVVGFADSIKQLISTLEEFMDRINGLVGGGQGTPAG